MTSTVFLIGAPGSSLLLLASELDRERGVRALMPWNVAAMLSRLREATAHRAAAWRGPLGGGGEWVDRALELFAPALIAALVERERTSRGDLAVLALGHFELGRRVDLLVRCVPGARFVLCASDGRAAASGRIPSDGPDRELAVAGFAWARAWSACVAPALALRDELGDRLFVLSDASLQRAPDDEKRRLLAWLGLEDAAPWTGTRPWSRNPSSAAALEGFACCVEATDALRELGFEPPEPGDVVARTPTLASAWIEGLVARGELERARAWLDRTRDLAPHASVATAEASLHVARGELDAAVACWIRAIEIDSESADAWVRLFERADRPETLLFADRARRAADPRIRGALARWMVKRGLDPEAAELVASVEHQAWPTAR